MFLIVVHVIPNGDRYSTWKESLLQDEFQVSCRSTIVTKLRMLDMMSFVLSTLVDKFSQQVCMV